MSRLLSLCVAMLLPLTASANFFYSLDFGGFTGGETSHPDVNFGPANAFSITNIQFGSGLAVADDAGIADAWEVQGATNTLSDAMGSADYVEFTLNTPLYNAEGCPLGVSTLQRSIAQLTPPPPRGVFTSFWSADGYATSVDAGSNQHSPAVLVSSPALGMSSLPTSTTYRVYIHELDGADISGNVVPADGQTFIDEIGIEIAVPFGENPPADCFDITIPEPSTALLGSLVVGAAFFRRRR